MPGIVSLDEAVLGPYKKLSGDATLISASYLNGANRIFPSPHRRDLSVNPALMFQARFYGREGDQDQVCKFHMWIYLYLDANVDYDVNKKRAGIIQIRINQLLDRQTFTGAAGVTYTNCFDSGNAMPLTVDTTLNAKREHVTRFEYYFDACKA